MTSATFHPAMYKPDNTSNSAYQVASEHQQEYEHCVLFSSHGSQLLRLLNDCGCTA